MNTWRRETFAALLVVVMALLSACGNQEAESTTNIVDELGLNDSNVVVDNNQLPDLNGGNVNTDPQSDNVAASVNGSVMMLLTDAPSEEFSEINMTITKLELLGGDQGNATLFTGMRKIDLLSLRNFSNLFAMDSNVAPGVYSKIRMHLDDIELVRRDADGEITETIHPKLVANGKLDFNPRGEFVVAPGKSMVIQLDMDAEKSVHLVKAGGKGKKPATYKFRPVVFIDIVDMVDYGGKLVRVEGDVTSVDPLAQTVKICNLKNFDGAECILVTMTDTTAVYGEHGAAVSLENLQQLERGIAIGYMNINNGQGYMNAVTLELGPARAFWHVKGDVTAPPIDDTNVFHFRIDPGQGFIAGTEFRVLPAPGAKLFSSQGQPLPWSEVQNGRIVEIEGILDRYAAEGYTFVATVVYLDVSQAAEQLSGVVSNLDLDAMSFDVTTAELGDRCVTASATVSVYTVSGGQDGVSGGRGSFADIQNGGNVDLYGGFDSGGCFVADDILLTTN